MSTLVLAKINIYFRFICDFMKFEEWPAFIITNRMNREFVGVKHKIFTRDLFRSD